MTRKPTQARIWAALVTVYVLWGSTYLGIRWAEATIPPLLMSGVRFLIAGAILFLWRLPSARRNGETPSRGHWMAAFLVGVPLILGGNGGVALAERTVPSGVTAVMVALTPLWMALIDRFVFHRRLNPWTWTGIVVGFGGVAFLIGLPGSGRIDIVGASIVVVASLSWAAGSIYSREAKLPKDSSLGIGMEMLAGGACLCIASAIFGDAGRLHVARISPLSYWSFAYLVVFGAIVGFSAYLWLLRVTETSRVATYAYVNPVVAVALGAALGHEPISARTVAAGAVILTGVALIVANSKPPEGAAEAGP
ncbi:MAG: EamA family transporter [Candidatus Eremiobacteraeota bacterium]|nr:EamA family transporter [Candidatus Eremiobacteraeota bacterium]MBC5828491.1 EamA family transporter [Candidatus Eremiobacteraeota bacterium]